MIGGLVASAAIGERELTKVEVCRLFDHNVFF